MDVYFGIKDHLFRDSFPTCDFVEINYNFLDSFKLPINDPRIKFYEGKDGYYLHENHSGIHYFNDVGFLKCKVCGWCPTISKELTVEL